MWLCDVDSVCEWCGGGSLCVFVFFFVMNRRPPRSTQSRSSAASDVYKRQIKNDPSFGCNKLDWEIF